MSAEIIDANDRFKKPVDTNDDGPYMTGACRCLACKHEWEGVAPSGAFSLECPSCGLWRGAFVANIRWGAEHWVCNCGNVLFAINLKVTYCVSCGLEQRF